MGCFERDFIRFDSEEHIEVEEKIGYKQFYSFRCCKNCEYVVISSDSNSENYLYCTRIFGVFGNKFEINWNGFCEYYRNKEEDGR